MFDVKLKGYNRVANKYRRQAAAKSIIIDPIVGSFAKHEQKKLRRKPYPSYLPHFKHRRKKFFGGLAGSYSAVKLAAAQWKIVNSQAHAGLVIGDKQKNHPSFLRWWKMRSVIAEDLPEMRSDIIRAIESDFEK